MKDASKPSGKVALVDDAKPISIPMISSSTSGGIRRGGASAPGVSAAVVAAVAEQVAVGEQNSAVVVVKQAMISRTSQVECSSTSKMVSRGTQTAAELLTPPVPNQPPQPVVEEENLQEKRRLIRKQLAVLLHAVLCRVRDELIGNTGEQARECPTAFCSLMKTVINHLRTCDSPAQQDCPHPHCLSSRQILSHWKSCTQPDCPVCSSLRRVVPAYLDAVVQNPRWRGQIITRFHWLINFIRPVGMRLGPVPVAVQLPQITRQQQEEMDEEEVRSHTRDAEE